MQPVPCDDEDLKKFERVIDRVVIGPPSGDPTDEQVRSVEVIVCDASPDFAGAEKGDIFYWHIKVAVEDGDMEKLDKDGHFWFTAVGSHLQPFGFGFEEKLLQGGTDGAEGVQ